MTAVFEPPVAFDMPLILPSTRGVQYRLFRYFGGNPRGRTVVLINGHYVTVDNPSTDLLTGTEGVDYFLGGHTYVAPPQDVIDQLEDDGYTITYPGTWGSYAATRWSALAPDFWAAPT